VRRLVPICTLALAAVLGGCGGDEETTSTTAASGGGECEPAEEPPVRNVKLDPPAGSVKGERLEALVKTNCGDFVIKIDTKGSPKTAASFAHMADEGVYDDTLFQRIVPGFVIQGGDPRGDGTGDAGYSVEEPPAPDATYTRGVVAMAKTGAEPPGTSGSQFFVVVAADAGLPAEYAVLGEVTSGEETLDAIEAQGNPPDDADPAAVVEPKKPVVIEEITIK
jgi:cyclophilin family peptidyl-prolyl cis-trans isomerase